MFTQFSPSPFPVFVPMSSHHLLVSLICFSLGLITTTLCVLLIYLICHPPLLWKSGPGQHACLFCPQLSLQHPDQCQASSKRLLSICWKKTRNEPLVSVCLDDSLSHQATISSVKVKNLRERESVERGSIHLAWPFPAHCWDGGKHKTSLNSTNPSLRENTLFLILAPAWGGVRG